MISQAPSSPSVPFHHYASCRTTFTALLAALVVLGASACADLPPIDDGVCGNHVTDGAEDCDESSTSCHPPGHRHQCRFACDAGSVDSDPIECPAGYGCGVDKVCRAAHGRFVLGTFEAGGATVELARASFDGDGRYDLFHGSREVSSALFYADNFNTQAVASLARQPWGPPPMLGDLDDDGFDDMVFGLELGKLSGTGLAVYRSTGTRAFESQTYSSAPLPMDHARFVRIDVRTASQDVVVGFVGSGGSSAIVGLMDDSNAEPVALSVPDFVGQTLGPEDLVGLAAGHFYNLSDSLCEDIAFSFSGGGDIGPAPRVWVIEVCTIVGGTVQWKSTPDNLVEVHPLTIPAGTQVAAPKLHDSLPGLRSTLHRADINGDGLSDLLLVVEPQSAQDDSLLVAFGHPDGGFHSDAALGLPVDNTFGTFVDDVGQDVGCVGPSTVLAVGDLTGNGADDLVTDRGILLRKGGLNLNFNYHQTECGVQWTSAAVADFDRDGVGDVVATRGATNQDTPDETLSLANGLDVRLSAGDGAFTRSVIPTSGPALWAVAGDFDGDSVADVGWVVAEIDVDLEDPSERPPDVLQVAFGRTFAGFSSPATIGTLLNVTQLVSGRFASRDGTSDMLVLSGFPGEIGVAVVAGSSSRQLVAPFIFFAGGGVLTVTGLAFGDLVDDADEQVNGAFAVLTRDDSTSYQEQGAERVWLVQQHGPNMALAASESEYSSVDNSLLCPNDCVLVAVDVDPESAGEIDEILVLGKQESSGGTTDLSVLEVSGSGLARKLEKRALDAVDFDFDFFASRSHDLNLTASPLVRDLDGDGVPDVLAPILDGAGWHGLVVLWNDETGSFAETHVIAASQVDVASFAVLNVDTDPEMELAVVVFDDNDYGADSGNVVLLDLNIETRQYTPLLEGTNVRVWWEEDESEELWADSLTAGDFDGDGVDDLVAGDSFGYYLLKGEAVKP